MSQYIHFFLKTKDDYYPIGTYNRSNIIYQMFCDHAPYEAVQPLTGEELNEIIAEAKEEIEHCKESIKDYNEKIEWLKGAHLTLNECLDTLEEYMQYKNENERTIKRIEEGISFVNHLKVILGEAYDDNHYTSDPCRFWLNEDAYIYFGIECSNPNLEWDDYGIISNSITGYVREEKEENNERSK